MSDLTVFDEKIHGNLQSLEICVVIDSEDRKICQPFLTKTISREKFRQELSPLVPTENKPKSAPRNKRPISVSSDDSDTGVPDKKTSKRPQRKSYIYEREEVKEDSDDGYDFDKEPKLGQKTAGSNGTKASKTVKVAYNPDLRISEWQRGTFFLNLDEVFSADSEKIKENHGVWKLIEPFIVQKFQRGVSKSRTNGWQAVICGGVCAPLELGSDWKYLQLEQGDEKDIDEKIYKKLPHFQVVRYPAKEELDAAREKWAAGKKNAGQKGASSNTGDMVRMLFTLDFSRTPSVTDKQTSKSGKAVVGKGKKVEEERKQKEEAREEQDEKEAVDAVGCLLKNLYEQLKGDSLHSSADTEKLELLKSKCEKSAENMILKYFQAPGLRTDCMGYLDLEVEKIGMEKKEKIDCNNCGCKVKDTFKLTLSFPAKIISENLKVKTRENMSYYKMYRLCSQCSSRISDFHLLEFPKYYAWKVIQEKMARYRMLDPYGDEDWEEKIWVEKEVKDVKRRLMKLLK